MNKQQIYRNLESKMLSYYDLVNVPVIPINEALVPIGQTENLIIKIIDKNMRRFTGERIFVRKSVADKLLNASRNLATKNPELQLQIVYGYRALSIQKTLFSKYKNDLSAQHSDDSLIEAAHRLVAVPEIAGHPTGGAIDIQIVLNRDPMDFGTTIWEFTQDSYTFSPFICKAAKYNRWLLRTLLLNEGFAPFDGEWWHFSYGDKEWAKYYNKPNAIYEQIDFNQI